MAAVTELITDLFTGPGGFVLGLLGLGIMWERFKLHREETFRRWRREDAQEEERRAALAYRSQLTPRRAPQALPSGLPQVLASPRIGLRRKRPRARDPLPPETEEG